MRSARKFCFHLCESSSQREHWEHSPGKLVGERGRGGRRESFRPAFLFVFQRGEEIGACRKQTFKVQRLPLNECRPGREAGRIELSSAFQTANSRLLCPRFSLKAGRWINKLSEIPSNWIQFFRQHLTGALDILEILHKHSVKTQCKALHKAMPKQRFDRKIHCVFLFSIDKLVILNGDIFARIFFEWRSILRSCSSRHQFRRSRLPRLARFATSCNRLIRRRKCGNAESA